MPEGSGSECAGFAEDEVGGVAGSEGGPPSKPFVGESEYEAAGAFVGASLAPGGGVGVEALSTGAGAEVLSAGAGSGEVVASASVGADDGEAKKEDGIGDGSTGAEIWADGVPMAGVSETDGVGSGAGIEVETLGLRVSMLTVQP